MYIIVFTVGIFFMASGWILVLWFYLTKALFEVPLWLYKTTTSVPLCIACSCPIRCYCEGGWNKKTRGWKSQQEEVERRRRPPKCAFPSHILPTGGEMGCGVGCFPPIVQFLSHSVWRIEDATYTGLRRNEPFVWSCAANTCQQH